MGDRRQGSASFQRRGRIRVLVEFQRLAQALRHPVILGQGESPLGNFEGLAPPAILEQSQSIGVENLFKLAKALGVPAADVVRGISR